MGWWSTHIMGGDTPLDIQSYVYDVLGQKQFPKGYDADELKLTAEHFDSKPEAYDKLMEKLKDWGKDDMRIGRQVFAYMLMTAGGKMTDKVRKETTQACKKDSWAKEDEERREHTNRLMEHIQHYADSPVDNLEKDYGLFAQFEKKLGSGIDLEAETMKSNMEKELEELKSDERNYYPTATVFANAPLALIQAQLSAQINLLEKHLNRPLSKFPLEREKVAEE